MSNIRPLFEDNRAVKTTKPQIDQEFALFWSKYPRRIAKIDARKAYEQARRTATAAEILAGVERYLDHLPESITFVPYPATWLRAGRWMDEPDAEIGGRLAGPTPIAQAMDDFELQVQGDARWPRRR